MVSEHAVQILRHTFYFRSCAFLSPNRFTIRTYNRYPNVQSNKRTPEPYFTQNYHEAISAMKSCTGCNLRPNFATLAAFAAFAAMPRQRKSSPRWTFPNVLYNSKTIIHHQTKFICAKANHRTETHRATQISQM